jgi:uncharacterized Ntn-hydrolase superfamily protein
VKTARPFLGGLGVILLAFLLVGHQGPLAPSSPIPSGPQGRAAGDESVGLHLEVAETLLDHTFSIVAMDPETGEVGVAVTTRNACVGNRVPWVRAGVGAVATQAFTRPEYGKEILDLMAEGMTPEEALREAVSGDQMASRRQVGVVGASGATAQHTGNGTSAWAGDRSGKGFATQGNLLAGPQVLQEVVRVMEETRASGHSLAHRLIAALEAGHAAGGDARKGRRQSAAVIVADPREGQATRPDGQTVFLSVCEHADPVAEVRRQHESVSQTLGYRDLQVFAGSDVWQLKVILHSLGFFRPDQETLVRDADANTFTPEAAQAVDRFRGSRGLSTPDDGSPNGFVDKDTVVELWQALGEAGKETEIRMALRAATAIRN